MESGIGEFLRQIPAPLIGMSCLSAIVLIGVIAYISWSRSNRSKLATQPAVNFMTPAPAPAAPVSTFDESSLGDMPDLDVLTTPAPEATARPSGTYRVKLSEGDLIDVVEVVTILRDVADGGLLVQIGEKVYRNPPASADTEFKRRFNLTMKELATGKRASVETAEVSSPPAPVESSPAPKATSETPTVAVSPTIPTAPPTPSMIPPGVAMPGDLPKFKMPDNPEIPPRRGRKPPVKEAIPEINIAAAIESYLQHKLSLTPAYAGRNIHVRPASHGGVIIDVDGQLFDSVSEVEDVEVREFLAATIAEWQSRQ